MLKEFSILAIAMIGMVASKWLPFEAIDGHVVVGSPVLIPGSGSCEASRSDCNVCGCYQNRVQCTNLNCNSLPPEVKNSNAVANINLPSWPGPLSWSSSAAVGRVHRWNSCGFCVRTADFSYYCISRC